MNAAGRYAPSPTGDLHLGNLRTALLAWLYARSTGRRFLLRIDDLDPQRSSESAARRQLDDLAALGIDADGPPMVQSDRIAAYAAALSRLADQTYPCFCTRREIAEATLAPHPDSTAERLYPGTCRTLTASQRAERSATRPPALRLRSDVVERTVTDLIHGPVTGPVDDVVLRRNDGVPAYNLAVVVDDGAQQVDQVVRGDDLLSSGPRQAYLAELLGLPVPIYAHVPLAVNADGARLAKRDGAVTMADLADHGLDADGVRTVLAASLGLAEPDESVTPDLLLRRFDPAALPRDPWVVTPEPAVP